jgi:hypothetical protein
MPSASIISDFQRSSSSSSLFIPDCQQYDINDLSYRFEQQQNFSSMNDSIAKKSQNMTECVPVPSSEHVAEIVGRQGKLNKLNLKKSQFQIFFFSLGCKIKALRTKTNTYIKTPVRGDQPLFIITGRREDVYIAKKEILSAAEHFSQIRAGKINFSFSNKTYLLLLLFSSKTE